MSVLGFAQMLIKGVIATPNSYTSVITQSTTFSIGGTTSGINTSGANIIIIGLSYYTAFGANISDSKGNTWTQLNVYFDNNMAVTTYYSINPIVGASHTFTTTSRFCGVNVLAATGTQTPVFDQQSGNAANASGNIQPGNITPPAGNIMLSIFGTFNGTTPSIPSGFTSIGTYTTATAEGGGCGYIIQATSTAQNPTWNSSGSSQAVMLVSFK